MKGLIIVGLLATTGLAHASPTSPADHRLKIVEYASATSFEYDVRAKGVLGDVVAPYATVWTSAMRNCDVRGGYVTEYHDGFKRSYYDTREGSVRVNAYATCRVAEDPFAHLIKESPMPVASIVTGDGLGPSTGLAQASGEPHAAYRAVRDLVYKTCLDQGRRVRFMSTHVDNRPNATPQVEGRFACNSGLDAGNQRD
ncbi:hypothetical protein [Luteibacter sp. 22Crub2.1]|uniref:hypothetical protein n=1 Tax=Luteibacter sp. 22Crub2.1 TaxID=1283288 RepID=UPI0009A617CF|nr:hypothetical protein [Luteibacter sp. 22Crub2.1]SKB35993.1 hypothetical protein SAMN05660880_00676 [Luteibacter sp. 22Crub2.1]